MNKSEPLSHDDALALLPWLVNDSLTTEEREQVETHARNCIVCRRELEQLGKLQASIQHVARSASVPELEMHRINARIDAMLTHEKQISRAFESLREFFGRPWQLAFAAQTLVLVGLFVFFIVQRPEPAEFTTLTNPEPSSPEGLIRVVFDPDLETGAVADLLDLLALDLVSGPSERGVATLRPVEPDEVTRDELLSRLLDQPGVLFAAPVTGSEP